MKSIKLILAIAVCTNLLYAQKQKFPFPKSAISDSVVLEKTLTDIASKIIPTYKNSNKVDSLDKLSKLEILAGNYSKASSTINQYREAYAGTNNAVVKLMAYDVYAAAKKFRKKIKKIIFPHALELVFNKKI